MKNPLFAVQSVAVVILVTFTSYYSVAQSISGTVVDENSQPVPFANIYIQELQTGTSADASGNYFLTIDPGIYHIVVSSLGFESVTQEVVIGDKAFIKTFQLRSSVVQLREVEVRVKRRDPAYEIIRNAIDNKEKYRSQITSSRTNVYLRAMETVDNKKKKEPEQEYTDDGKGPPPDPLAEARKQEEARLQRINLVEMDLVLNYAYPDRYKEERNGFKSYGSKDGLFIPVFSEIDFNFYDNLVGLKGISDVPLISPLSRTAILSYKYKLEETLKEDGQVVYKIRVTPYKTGDATCRGFVFINEGTWNINRLELTMQKGALKFYDAFTIKQTYKKIDRELWIPVRQEFDYQTKAGKKTFKGNTVILFTDFQNGYTFPEKFFGNEVAVTTSEAYKRDSVYWNNKRPEPLTGDQKKVIRYRDSVEAIRTSKKYLDSIEARYNKVTVGEVLYHGLGFRNQEKKRNLFFPSLVSLIGFEVVGGFRLGPYMSYWREFQNGRQVWTNSNFSIGLKNADWQGGLNFWTRYNPKKLGDFSFRVGRNFHSINSFDAYLNQLKISNYILHEYIYLFHRMELVNGLYAGVELNFSNRKSIDGYDATSIINEVLDETEAIKFEGYQALISTVKFSYTPGQRFMTEPNRKVVLGSKWPTVSVSHKKGWNGVLTSDIDFDYLEFMIEQNLLLGTLGNSRYTFQAGKFMNTRDLRYVDLKRFRQSDPYLYSNPLYSFQSLDTSLVATDIFLEGHYIHHFNGALINNIPLIKKLKLRTVAGAGFVWIKESGYRHEEIFGGVERTFKLGARRRLKVGAFGILGQSNTSPPTTDFKISFDLIDTWKRDWSY